MKRLIAVLWMISTLAVGIVWAQSFPPNEAGVTMGHWYRNPRYRRFRPGTARYSAPGPACEDKTKPLTCPEQI